MYAHRHTKDVLDMFCDRIKVVFCDSWSQEKLNFEPARDLKCKELVDLWCWISRTVATMYTVYTEFQVTLSSAC